MNIHKQIILTAACFAATCFPHIGNAALISLSTGDFINSEWSSNIHPTSTGTSTGSTETTGGNPDAYRRVSLTVSGTQSVLNSQIWETEIYNPSVQGSVLSVGLSYDVRRVFTTNGNATQIAKGVVVKQDGVIYLHLAGVTSSTIWDTGEAVSITDIVPLFPLVDWASGGAINFGFYDSVSTSGTAFTLDGGYDNFEVNINSIDAVPIPATVFLLASGLLGLAGVGYRKQNLGGKA